MRYALIVMHYALNIIFLLIHQHIFKIIAKKQAYCAIEADI